MSRHESQSAGSNVPDKLRSKFQISVETGISQNYFNKLLNLLPGDVDGAEKPNEYFLGGEKEMREKLQTELQKYISYSEDVDWEVKNFNEFEQKHGSDKRITRDDFINSQNQETIRRLDEMAATIKTMRDLSPDQIDIPRLKQIIYEMSVLIYGESKRETLKQRFKIT